MVRKAAGTIKAFLASQALVPKALGKMKCEIPGHEVWLLFCSLLAWPVAAYSYMAARRAARAGSRVVVSRHELVCYVEPAKAGERPIAWL